MWGHVRPRLYLHEVQCQHHQPVAIEISWWHLWHWHHQLWMFSTVVELAPASNSGWNHALQSHRDNLPMSWGAWGWCHLDQQPFLPWLLWALFSVKKLSSVLSFLSLFFFFLVCSEGQTGARWQDAQRCEGRWRCESRGWCWGGGDRGRGVQSVMRLKHGWLVLGTVRCLIKPVEEQIQVPLSLEVLLLYVAWDGLQASLDSTDCSAAVVFLPLSNLPPQRPLHILQLLVFMPLCLD